MTKEQIAELERAFPPVGRGDTVTLTMTRAEHEYVRRVLKEREALLQACKAFVDRAKELNAPMTASEVMARNAIWEAEWP